MDLHLAGKNAIVTGATRGIGRAIAQRFTGEGAHVAICARQSEAVVETVASLRMGGTKVSGKALDVSDASALRAWIEQAAAELGGIDIVVANASAMSFGLSREAFQAAFDIDLMHTVTVVEAAMPYLERSGTGSIVAIASIAGVEDLPLNSYEEASYATMKAALLSYMKSLARAVAPKGIRANVVSPGNTYFEGGAWQQVEQQHPDIYRSAIAMTPMGRMAEPPEIANVVAFVASPAAGFMTGANLIVDGGFTRRI